MARLRRCAACSGLGERTRSILPTTVPTQFSSKTRSCCTKTSPWSPALARTNASPRSSQPKRPHARLATASAGSGRRNLDGGDVLRRYGGKVWVGRGGRTNQEGIDQLASLLSELGAEVITVPLTKVLHLKTAVTALPDGTVVGYEPLVDDPDMFENFMAVPEEAGAHVVLLGGNKVLMSTSAPKTKELFEARGLDVVAVDISEYEARGLCDLSVRAHARTRRLTSSGRGAIAPALI